MADKKISQLSFLAQADVATTSDYLPINDASATAATMNKKILVSSLVNSVLSTSVSTPLLTVTTGHILPVNKQTLGTTKALTITDPTYQVLDAGGADRDVTLPNTNSFYAFIVKNNGTANTLTVKDSTAAVIIYVYPGESFTLLQTATNSWVVL